jgi:hypothetical protein
MKITKLYSTFILTVITILVGCINTSNKSKFELKEGEKFIELNYDRVEAEMDEFFIFKLDDGTDKDFLISYNDNEAWDQISKKLVKGEKYGLIYKPFSNQKIIDSLTSNNIASDDYPASGDYIYYIEDSKGNVIFKNNFFSVKTSDKNEPAAVKNDSPEIANEYIEYLSNYGFEGHPEIKFVTIEDNNFWVTINFGSGTHQEYFWILNKNKLIPMFIFEYGGENWESKLNYTFISINKKDTLEGNVIGVDSENQIEVLKKKFITKNL